MIIRIHQENPNKRDISKIVKYLKNGGVIIYPTDSGYAFGCDPANKKAIEKLLRLKKTDKKHSLSLVCSDLKSISKYAEMSDTGYKAIKKYLPGPYTFILEAKKAVSKLVCSERKTVGIKTPDMVLSAVLVEELEHPLITASINRSKDIDSGMVELLCDTDEIEARYGSQVGFIIDGGYIYPEYTTVIDISDDEAEILREGKGSINWLV